MSDANRYDWIMSDIDEIVKTLKSIEDDEKRNTWYYENFEELVNKLAILYNMPFFGRSKVEVILINISSLFRKRKTETKKLLLEGIKAKHREDRHSQIKNDLVTDDFDIHKLHA